MGSQRFLALVRQFHVNYVLSGHYHELVHMQSADTMFIVTGGGGATLLKQTPGKPAAFHHAIVFDVTPAGITERILPVQAASLPLRMFRSAEYWAGARIAPLLLTSAALITTVNVAVGLLMLLAVVDLSRQRRRAVRPGSGAP